MGVQQVSQNQRDTAVILESPEVQSFITSFLLEVSDSLLKPKISFDSGISYPTASSFLHNRNNDQVNAFLEKLSKAGLLEGTLVDKLIACPSCKSTKVYSKYQCDKCKSINISSVEILEHRLCGYVGAKSSYILDSQRADTLICPKCKQSFANENDYRKLGNTFECASCRTRFDVPPVVHDCKKCGKIFNYRESEYEPVYEYVASSKMKEIFSSGAFFLGAVVRWLKDRGFRVEAPKEAMGTSKERHRFDVVASAGVMENLLLGDFASSLDNKTVIATFAKRYDVNQNAKSFIVTYGKISDSIEMLARTYGISIIVVDPLRPETINDQLSRMVAGTPQVVPLSSPSTSRPSLEPKRVDRRFPPPSSGPIPKSNETEQMRIINNRQSEKAPEGRLRKTKSRKLRQPEKKAVKLKKGENEPPDYYLENDFGLERSDDVFLSDLDEVE